MDIRYKPSMFYYNTHIDNSVVLYNSLMGVKSICKISAEKEKKVTEWLKAKEIVNCDDDDFSCLLNYGYFVPINTNEKHIRNALYAEFMADSTLNLVIHTTKQCNFRCQYCYLDFESKSLDEDMEERILLFIQKQLHMYNCVKISWFGGEPLLGIDSIERISQRVIKLCERAKKPYYSSITTNGYLLTPLNLQKLVSLHVDHYTITIDGLKESHDSLRFLVGHKPSFDTILKNLIYIRDKINQSRIRVIIRSNLTRKTAIHYRNFYSYFNELFGNDHRFSLFVRPVRDAGGESVKTIENDLLTNSEFAEIMTEVSEIAKEGRIGFLSNYSELEPAGFTCPAMCRGKYTIDVDGNVGKCDSIEPDLKIGYLDEKGNLIHNGTREEDWITGCFDYNEQCEDCFFSAVCFKGTCPVSRIRNDISKCVLRNNEIDALIKLYTEVEKIISL